MDFVEASNMELEKESQHWWIKTRFQYIDLALETLIKSSSQRGDKFRVLEVGCGTGQNLAYIRNKSIYHNKIASLVGIDLNLPSGFFRQDLGKEDQLLSGSDELKSKSNDSQESDENKFDLLILMDVIEHVDDPIALIESYKDFLRPGAHILITVPAFQSLWSQHDVLLD